MSKEEALQVTKTLLTIFISSALILFELSLNLIQFYLYFSLFYYLLIDD